MNKCGEFGIQVKEKERQFDENTRLCCRNDMYHSHNTVLAFIIKELRHLGEVALTGTIVGKINN